MIARRTLLLALGCLLLPRLASALEDPGKNQISELTVRVFYGTDEDPTLVGKGSIKLDDETAERLRSEELLRFRHYRQLGEDTQPLLRSYDSWAQPLKPSDEIMVRMEANGVPSDDFVRLDLELWLGRKKTIKMDAQLSGDRPLLVLGPEWRGGRLIISVALAQNEKAGS